MLERLELIRLQPAAVVDVGCGLGHGAARLQQHYPGAEVVGVDLAATLAARAATLHGGVARDGLADRMRRWFGGEPASRAAAPVFAAADAASLPLRAASVDLIWSNLAWHWFSDPLAVLDEWYRVIRPGGLLMFSAFGVDTLRELRPAGAQLPDFPDMHDIGDALGRAGFADPVMDSERLTITWESAATLLDELASLGGNPLRARTRGLAGRARRSQWLAALEAIRPDGGPIALSFELVFGHAWCPASKPRSDGYSPITFSPTVAPRGRTGRKT